MINMEAVLICFGTFCASLSCIYFTELSTWLRNKLHKKVQCWFCHVGSRVKYVDSNSWTCPSCDQYNGFTKEGDYNKEIPSQFDDRFNPNVSLFRRLKSSFKRQNSLCSRCNYNQELKVKQLAAFVPINEAKYDQEIEHYRLQLEDSYKLCRKCEQLVTDVISNQKYIAPGPRRLAHITKQLVFKSYWTLYCSMILSLLVIINRIPSLLTIPNMESFPISEILLSYLTDPLMIQMLSGLGVLLHTLQCCLFGTYWSFVNWSVWSLMASSPHFLHTLLPDHVSYVQMAISLSLFTSNLIIILRRKKHETASRIKQDLRKKRKNNEDLKATWTSFTNKFKGNEEVTEKKSETLPARMPPSSSPKSECSRATASDGFCTSKTNLLKPVARVPQSQNEKEDLDLSALSIGSKYDNPFAKSTFVPSPWDRVTMTRSSSHSSGISSLRASPLGWKTNQTTRSSPDSNFAKHPRSSPFTGVNDNDWTMRNSSFNSVKEPNFKRVNDAWTPMSRNQWDVNSIYDHNPEWDVKKTSVSPNWPVQVYSYPVAYTWPGVSPQWDRSSQSFTSVRSASTSRPDDTITKTDRGGLSTSLPTIILAATNAALVYYIIYSKS